MNSREFPEPELRAAIDSRIEFNSTMPVVLRNSRFLCWTTVGLSLFAAFFAVCMVLVVVAQVFPLSDLTVEKGWSALFWAFGACATGSMCPWLWAIGRAMADYEITLDSRGIDFSLGTKEEPQELFLAWDRIAAIKHKRVGSAQQYSVVGTDGSQAIFTSYTFFRPKKVARMIAARTGQAIQKA